LIVKKVLLRELAFARSGDKGDVSDIGIMAKSKNIYDLLVKTLTPEKIKEHFKGMVKGDVEVYPMPNINSIEIVLRQALGGGATCTLRFDQTGKSIGQALLRLQVEADDSLVQEAEEVDASIRKRFGPK
jgi:phosphoribosylaminoimidazole-succinocarboxamide synthase